MEQVLFLSILISFFLTLYALPKWIKRAKEVGLAGKDMNKYKKPVTAEAGGVVVVSAFIIGVLSYIAIRTFIIKDVDGISLQIFAVISSVMMLAFIGIIDGVLGWKKGLGRRIRLFMCIFAAIPLVVINAGSHTVDLPFFGPAYFGVLYSLILIPLGIVGASTTFNFLAGFNGLEAGQGIIIISFLSFISYLTGSAWLSIVGLCMVAALLAFYFYNKFPAKVFPGDVITYPLGGLIAIMAILGNFEKIAVFVFMPYIIETILKIRGKLVVQSFAIPDKDNNLKMPCEKVCGMTHLSILTLNKFGKKVTEKGVVYLIFVFQILLCLLALVIFRGSLF